MAQLSNFANTCILQKLSQGGRGMKLLADTVRGLSVDPKILLTEKKFTLCNIYMRIGYYRDNYYFKFIKISKKTILFVLTSCCCDMVLRGRIALCLNHATIKKEIIIEQKNCRCPQKL